MGTEVTLFSDKGGLPAWLTDINEESNIEVRERIPQLSFRGKVWRIVMGGNEEVINRPGTDDPASMVAGIFLNYNKARSRAYFEGAYEEGKSSAPTCWSHDGVVPHESVQNKQAATCAICPQSAKGSKITDAGKEVTACAQFKRVAFVPLQNTKHPMLLLKLPQTSIWDKDAEEWAAKGWYAFDQYVDMLHRRGIKHTASVVTKIRFDPRTAYPKLLFGPLDYVPQAVADDIRAQLALKDEINKILNVDPEGVDPVATAAAAASAAPPAVAAPAKAPTPAKAAPAPAAPPPPEPPADPDEDDAAAMMAAVTGTPAKAPTPAPAAAINAKAPAKATTKAATKAAPPPAKEPTVEVVGNGSAKASGIGDLLSSWSDE